MLLPRLGSLLRINPTKKRYTTLSQLGYDGANAPFFSQQSINHHHGIVRGLLSFAIEAKFVNYAEKSYQDTRTLEKA